MSRKKRNRAEAISSASSVVPSATEWGRSIALASLALFVYLLTLSRYVPGGDSGELITVAALGSVAHPPGYPLYTMLAHLMTWILWGSAAFRVNLFSALCVAAFGAWFSLLLRRLGVRTTVAGSVSLIALFSPLFWRYAVVAEVFALHLLLCVALTDFFVRFVNEKRDVFGYGFALIVGLGASHHHTLVFLAFPLFLCAWRLNSEPFGRPRFWALSLLAFGAGLLPYLYLLAKANQVHLVSWGDLSTWSGFWDHILRREYGTFQLVSGNEKAQTLRALWFYLLELAKNSLWFGPALLVWGLWQGFFGKKGSLQSFFWALGSSLLFALVSFHLLSNADLGNRLHYDVHTRFWLMPNFLAFALIALVIERWMSLRPAMHRVALGILATSVVLQISLHYRQEDQSENDLFDRTARAMMSAMPENALYLVRGDIHVNAARYVQSVEGFRPDIRVLPLDLLWWPWMKRVVEQHMPGVILPGKVYRDSSREPLSFNLKDLIGANIENRAIFLGRLKPEEEALLKPEYDLWDLGFVMRVLPRGQTMDVSEYVAQSRPFDELRMPKKKEFRDSSWEAFVYYNYWGRFRARGESLYRRYAEIPEGIEWLKVLADQYEKILLVQSEEIRALDLKLLAAIYQKLAKIDPSYSGRFSETYQRYLASEPQKSAKPQ